MILSRKALENISYISLGNVVSRIIRFFGFVYIVNALGSEDYGTLLFVLTFIELFDIISLNGINKYGIREASKDLDNTHKIVNRIVGGKVFFALLTYSFLVFATFLDGSFSSDLRFYLLLHGLMILIIALNGIILIIFQSHENMSYLEYTPIIHSLVYSIFGALAVYYGYGILSLLIINLSSSSLLGIYLFFRSKRMLKGEIEIKFTPKDWDKQMYKSAVIFSLLGYMVFLSTKIDIVMVSYLGNNEEVAIYGIALVPLNQLNALHVAISMAIFPTITKSFADKGMDFKSLNQTFLKIFSLFLPLSLIIIFFSDYFVNLLFTDSYEASVQPMQVLIFSAPFNYASIPFIKYLEASGNESSSMLIYAAVALLNIPLNYFLYLEYGLIGIAYSTVIISSLKPLLAYLFARAIYNKNQKDLINT